MSLIKGGLNMVWTKCKVKYIDSKHHRYGLEIPASFLWKYPLKHRQEVEIYVKFTAEGD